MNIKMNKFLFYFLIFFCFWFMLLYAFSKDLIYSYDKKNIPVIIVFKTLKGNIIIPSNCNYLPYEQLAKNEKINYNLKDLEVLKNSFIIDFECFIIDR